MEGGRIYACDGGETMTGHPISNPQAIPVSPRYGGRVIRRPATLALQKDPYRILLFVLMVITLSRIHQNFGFLRPVRPALTLTILAAAYAYLNPKYLKIGGLFTTWPSRVIMGLGLTACLSVPLSISIGGSASFIIQEFSKTLLFAVLLIAGIRNTRDLYTMVWAFVVSTGCLSYLSIFVFRMRRATDDGLLRIQNGYSYDSNDIGLVVLVGLVLTLLLIQTASSKGKLICIGLLFGVGVTIAKTGSRGGFIGMAAVAVALLIMLKHVDVVKRVGFVVVLGLGLLVAAPAGYWEQMATILNPSQDYNYTSPTGRKAVFLRGVGYMMLNPFSGIGVDNFPRAEGTLSDRAVAQAADPNLAGIKWSAPHNSFLQAGAEMGVPGLLLFSTLVVGGIVGTIRLRRRLPKEWRRGDAEERFLYFSTVYFPVAFIAFAAAGAFVSFAYMDLVYVLGALTAGLIVCIDQRLSPAGRPAAPAHPRRGRRTHVPQARGPLPPPSGPAMPPQPPPGR